MSAATHAPVDPAVDARRRALRDAALARRLALSADEVERLGNAVCARLLAQFPAPPGETIAFCWPISNEPDLRPAMHAWHTAGAEICLPVVVRLRSPLIFRSWQPKTEMVPDHHGIPAPAAGEPVWPDVLIIPVNAFDAAGYRLGYGGGYFDRTLARMPAPPLVIGVGFELARVDSILPQAHDIPMDWMVTEAGAFAPNRPRD